MSNSLLEVDNLHMNLRIKAGEAVVLNGVSFRIQAGEILGLVGESGSGKTLTALSIVGLVGSAGRVVGGEVRLEGRNLIDLSDEELQRVRAREIAMVFQEPAKFLDPLQRVEDAFQQAFRLHREMDQKESKAESIDLLRRLKIPGPERVLRAYPFELSGGMCQRVMIGLALVGSPRVLIADECTSALDVTTQASILEMIDEMARELQMGVLLTTHSMIVVERATTRTAVMYAGRVVELAETSRILEEPLHPYTQGLIGSAPTIASTESPLKPIRGEPPSPFDIPEGCSFSNRCAYAKDRCRIGPVEFREISKEHWVACHFAEEIRSGAAT